MPNDRIYYVLCADNCKFEGMTKEQIFDAIAEATGHTPTPVDEAFITKIKEQNAQHNTKIWTGTEAEYNALAVKDPDTLYFVGGNKIQPGAGGQIDASDIISGEVALARGGTGQNFADFAALSDAVGSGGNWIDVSEKFNNEIVWNSGFTPIVVDAKIYEKRFLVLSFALSPTNALVTDKFYNIFTLPEWARPYSYQYGTHWYAMAELTPNGSCNFTTRLAVPAGGQSQASCFYILKTPYSE